ncbi:unnamed protein product [Phytophthora lilii]|uniref:Unnamed protein product n=1 Tax=Phytophthora lilii TaxID=2077276 RepID=A0A9W6WYA3_9STRA|nr:unnamed protein product [Phytophthora lilii]
MLYGAGTHVHLFAFSRKRQKEKKRADGESKEGEESDGSSTDEEETERQAQLLMEMQRKEADFDVRKYFSSMVSSDTIKMYCSLLADYRENSAKVNHYIHSFFYRTKHFQIYQQEEWTMQPMLFNIHVLLLFNKMLQDTYIQRLPEYKNFLDFIRGVVRDFFTLADKNNLLFVEALLRQPYPSKSCLLIQRSYDPIDSMSKSKSEAVALGREKQIEAINESRRHRIALDHEELEGEAEFQFTLGPSDFQSTSLADKEGKEDEGEGEFNADSNPTGAGSTAKPRPKRKAAMSRAATERAKNWSKVEDRYLAKVFVKYRHLPSVYEVISYEDMFQERDRTPEQIERRVKYLKLHRRTHDSSDEEENEQSNSDDERIGEIGENENTVRESRLEKDLATLDTARPRRRLRRGAEISDDDSDDDLLLGGPQAQAEANPAQSADTPGVSTNEELVAPDSDTKEPSGDKHVTKEPAADEPAVDDPVAKELVANEPAAEEPVAEEPAAEEPADASISAPNAETNGNGLSSDSSSAAAAQVDNANESEFQDMEETQVLEESLDASHEDQMGQSTATEATQEIDNAMDISVDASSPGPARVTAPVDGTEAGNDEPMNTEQSRKRERSDKETGDTPLGSTPMKKAHLAEEESPDAGKQ